MSLERANTEGDFFIFLCLNGFQSHVCWPRCHPWLCCEVCTFWHKVCSWWLRTMNLDSMRVSMRIGTFKQIVICKHTDWHSSPVTKHTDRSLLTVDKKGTPPTLNSKEIKWHSGMRPLLQMSYACIHTRILTIYTQHIAGIFLTRV